MSKTKNQKSKASLSASPTPPTPPTPPENLRSFTSLVEIIEILRGPQGCPWDKEQTHLSLVPFAIEEVYELAEAIESEHGLDEIKGELGDVLLQVVLHAEIARQNGNFDIYDVIESIGQKMVERHPHVFGDKDWADSSTVLQNWSSLKEELAKKNKQNKPNKQKQSDSSLKPEDKTQERFDVPLALPALKRAQKIGQKTRDQNFDWSNWSDVWRKLEEEVLELQDELKPKQDQIEMQKEKVEAELGDVLFTLVQLARHLDIDSEQAMREANRRFEQRYFLMLKCAAQDQKDWQKLSSSEKEKYWQVAKNKINQFRSSQL